MRTSEAFRICLMGQEQSLQDIALPHRIKSYSLAIRQFLRPLCLQDRLLLKTTNNNKGLWLVVEIEDSGQIGFDLESPGMRYISDELRYEINAANNALAKTFRTLNHLVLEGEVKVIAFEKFMDDCVEGWREEDVRPLINEVRRSKNAMRMKDPNGSEVCLDLFDTPTRITADTTEEVQLRVTSVGEKESEAKLDLTFASRSEGLPEKVKLRYQLNGPRVKEIRSKLFGSIQKNMNIKVVVRRTNNIDGSFHSFYIE